MKITKSPETARLFLISFLILFLELVCIRWSSSFILYLGYFTNFILLGCFLGIGAGTLLAHRSFRLIRWVPLALFVYFISLVFIRAQINPEYRNFIYFTNDFGGLRLPVYVILPLIFIAITTIFTLVSQDLGELLTRFAPLKAYSLNILGSLAGIAFFTLLSALSLPSWIWFVPIVIVLFLLLPRDHSLLRNGLLLVDLVAVLAASDIVMNNLWSPYYRISLFEVSGEQIFPFKANQPGNQAPDRLLLTVNGIGHQEFTPLGSSPIFYSLPYTVFAQKPDFQNVLVIGAGGGNDVAFALANGAKHVDAVEIDPRIADLGRKYHPEHPYTDPRVSVHVNDGRAFLEKTSNRYDLVIFALPDSLVLAANASNLRLESYLFTEEAFRSVRNHLAVNGMFVLYNYYRYDWLIEKINTMLYRVFGEAPVFHRYTEKALSGPVFATIFAGPKAKEIDIQQAGFSQAKLSPYLPATDNWPFLYLAQPSLPGFYSLTLLVILFFSVFYVLRISPKGSISRTSWPFFFMGAAFSLLETRSIVQFLLLFGSTWLVNSLVFFAVLLVVLIANGLVARYRFSRISVLFGLLVIALALNILIPLKALLGLAPSLRYILAIMLLFSPIFIANLIYSTIFRDTPQANTAFGANLLGTVVGGSVEYLSLLTGYQGLIFIAALFYFSAFYWILKGPEKVPAGVSV